MTERDRTSHEKTGYVSTAEASPRDGEAVRVHDAWLLTTQCWQRNREKGSTISWLQGPRTVYVCGLSGEGGHLLA